VTHRIDGAVDTREIPGCGSLPGAAKCFMGFIQCLKGGIRKGPVPNQYFKNIGKIRRVRSVIHRREPGVCRAKAVFHFGEYFRRFPQPQQAGQTLQFMQGNHIQ
jgi:hypothetical protein